MANLLIQAHDAKTQGSLEGSRSIFVVIFLAFLVMAMVYLLCGQGLLLAQRAFLTSREFLQLVGFNLFDCHLPVA